LVSGEKVKVGELQKALSEELWQDYCYDRLLARRMRTEGKAVRSKLSEYHSPALMPPTVADSMLAIVGKVIADLSVGQLSENADLPAPDTSRLGMLTKLMRR